MDNITWAAKKWIIEFMNKQNRNSVQQLLHKYQTFKMGLFDYLLSNKYQPYLNPDQEIDSRVAPKELIKELQQGTNMKKFLKAINKPSSNPIKIIRRLHICNLLILNSTLLFHSTEQSAPIVSLLSTDKWLNEEFISPYYAFLQKCLNQYEKYSQCTKSLIIENQIFEQLFFIINLLKLLFKTIHKLPLIGKFYKNKNPIVWQGVMDMIAIQAKQIYFTFKNILIIILQNTDKYLCTDELEKIMKNILIEDLSFINQEMKMLLLGKQFFPFGKGIGIKLFRVDDATQELENIMKGIMTDHCQTNRRLEKEWMQDELFNKKKGFNMKFFEQSINGVSQSQPLLKIFVRKKSTATQPISQEEVLSDQQDPQENNKKLAETNESNLNKVDYV